MIIDLNQFAFCNSAAIVETVSSGQFNLRCLHPAGFADCTRNVLDRVIFVWNLDRNPALTSEVVLVAIDAGMRQKLPLPPPPANKNIQTFISQHVKVCCCFFIKKSTAAATLVEL